MTIRMRHLQQPEVSVSKCFRLVLLASILGLFFLSPVSHTFASNIAAAPTNTWVDHNGLTHNARELIRMVNAADEHGLNPEKYIASKLTELSKQSHKSDNFTKHFDRAFTLLANDLGRGVVDAYTVQQRYYRSKPIVNSTALLQQLHDGETTVTELFDQLIPQHDDYQRLVSYMRQLLGEQATRIPRVPIVLDDTLAEGAKHEAVPNIKRRLRETGHLSQAGFAGNHFDNTVHQAVVDFQTDNGLEPTGAVDELTRDAMNITIADEIKLIAMSLERWRWLPRDLGYRHVFVNLPSYRLSMKNGSQEVANMAVVIGKRSHKTPQFSQNLSYLEFMPTWTVPAKITNWELLPLELRSPGYLEENGFEFMQYIGNRLMPVPRSSVTIEDMLTRPFPYTLQQQSGEDNALGQVKFMMPNPYAIYLHDTPAKSLFSKRKRAYSHGCIRVSDPKRLASLIMQIDGTPSKKVNSLWDSTETTQSKLREPVPTHLTYFTSWIDEQGFLQRRNDVYRQDSALANALRKANTLLSVKAERQIALSELSDSHQ